MRHPWFIASVIAGWVLVAALASAEDPEAGRDEPPEKPETSEKDEPRTVNLIIQGEEPDRFHLDVGGGWSEDDGFYGRLALSTNNLFGGGEILGAKVELGDDREVYELEYEMPFLFNRRQSVGVRLFKDARDHTVAGDAEFEQRRAGAALTYGRRFGRYHELDLEYRFADVDHFESAFDVFGDDIQRRTQYASSSVRSRWTYDRLDSRASPFRGWRLSGSLEAGGGVLGGDSAIVKPTFGVAWFQPVSGRPLRSTFGVRARVGWAGVTGGELFSQQRFFLGGEDSIRGFSRKSIAVTDTAGTVVRDAVVRDADGFPIGGDKMAQLSLEYHLLLGGPFRLVLFTDGGLLAEDQSFDLDPLRGSAGAELRITLPKLGLPLRLIYAHNLDPLPEDRFDDLSLSLGVSF